MGVATTPIRLLIKRLLTNLWAWLTTPINWLEQNGGRVEASVLDWNGWTWRVCASHVRRGGRDL